jgi:CheY-like chemotaxis protein
LRRAHDGRAARAAVAERVPDLCLIDMRLPDIDGLDLARQLRALAGAPALPCVAVSADAMPSQVRQALSGGLDAYLTKPLDISAVLDLVDRSAQPPAG